LKLETQIAAFSASETPDPSDITAYRHYARQ